MPKAISRRSIHATALTLGIALSGLPFASQAAQPATTVPAVEMALARNSTLAGAVTAPATASGATRCIWI